MNQTDENTIGETNDSEIQRIITEEKVERITSFFIILVKAILLTVSVLWISHSFAM